MYDGSTMGQNTVIFGYTWESKTVLIYSRKS